MIIKIKEPDAQIVRELERAEALQYLSSTDWMVIRAAETGESLDADVKAKRADARKKAST